MIVIGKIRGRKQGTDIGKYSFVNRTIKLWKQVPAEVLSAFLCKPHVSRRRVRKVLMSEVKSGELKCGDETP
jgi:hypothetical protein